MIVNEPQGTQKTVLDTPTNDKVATNTEALSADEVTNSVDVETSVEPTEPKKTFNKERAYDFIQKLNRQNGGKMSETRIASYSNSAINQRWLNVYRAAGAEMGTKEERDSIYESFFDVDTPDLNQPSEKKKTTESESTLEQRQSSWGSVREKNQIDWGRIEEAPEPILDGSTSRKIEHEKWVSEQQMLEEAEADYGKSFWLKPIDESDPSKFKGDEINTSFSQSSTLDEYIQKSDMSWFNMGESDAESAFTAKYGMMGFTAKQSGLGKDELVITSSSGATKEIRLFTDGYKRVAKMVGDEEYRDAYHKREIKQWMQSQVSLNDFFNPKMKGMPREKILENVQDAMDWGTKITPSDFKYLTNVFSNTDLAAMNDGLVFKPERAEFVITQKIKELNKQLKQKKQVNQSAYNAGEPGITRPNTVPDNSGVNSIKKLITNLGMVNDDIRARAKRQSSVLGASLLQTEAYKEFDFAGKDSDVFLMTSMGVDIRDLPYDQLTVNGRASSYSEIYNLITDYDGIKSIRKGDIQVGVNKEGVTSEVSLSMFKDLDAIINRNKAVRNMGLLGKDSGIGHYLRNTGINFGDFTENLALSTLEVVGQIQYAAYDAYKSLGISDDVANMVFAPSVFSPLPMTHPSHIKHLKEKHLPLYESGIADAESFGEFMAKGSSALAQSLPTSAVFMANPAAGLAVIGASSYGREIHQLDSDIIDAKKQLEEGGLSNTLSELRAQRMATMTRAEARGIALQIAGVETAVTRVFTYNFFKNAAAAKNFAGTKNATNAGKLSNAYQKIYYRNFIENTAYRLGVSPKALSRELSEEEIIAANTYAIRVAWGLQEYDAEEFANLLKETGINSAFSSVGMAKMAQTHHASKVNKSVDQFVKQNIKLPNEAKVADQHLRATDALEKEKNPRVRPQPFDGENNRYIRVDSDANAEIQERGSVKIPVKPNAENIKMLEQVVDETATQLVNFDKRKQELVDKMSKTDKKSFLDAMSDIERFQSALTNSTEGVIRGQALTKINLARERARRLMLKYPSTLSFNYLPMTAQSDYKERAVQEIIKERKLDKDNISYEITTTDGLNPYMLVPEGQLESENDISKEDIDAKAVELYLSESNTEAVKQMDGTLVMPGFNYLDAERMQFEVSESEIGDFNLRNELDFVQQMKGQGEIDFSKPVETKKKTGNLEVNEVLDFTGAQKPLVQDGNQDVALEGQKSSEINDEEVLVQEDMKPGLVIKNAITEDSKIDDQERIDNLLGRLDYYEKETTAFYENYLSANNKADIKTFFDDLRNGRRGNLGKVESIMNAVDVAVDIASQMPNKISILQENGDNPVAQALVNLSQQIYDGNTLTGKNTLATTTIMMQSLIKDSKVGKPFYDLNNEAGRITDAAKQKISKVKDEHLKAYEQDVKNDEDYKNASALKKTELANPNSLTNSYEMYVLGMMYRLSGENNIGNQDVEFARTKSLILQELAIRKSDYEAMPDNNRLKGQYFLWKQTVESLGVENANSYDDVRGNASSRNANAIDRIAEAQPNEAALKRIQDYNRFEPNVMNRYLPTFYDISNGDSYSDSHGSMTLKDGIMSADQTKDVTLPERLGGSNGLRLSPGMYYDQIYGSLQGLEMDINGRDTYTTLDNLMRAPVFQELFNGNVRGENGEMILSNDYKIMRDIFTARKDVFESDIRSSHRNTGDYGDVQTTGKQLANSAIGAAYSFYSAVSLGRITQNISQYQSAVQGVFPLLESKEAMAYMRRKNLNFYLGHSNVLNGNTSKSILSQALQSVYNNKPYAQNIYAQSRTGLRNSLSSELIVNQNKKYPISYYLRAYNLVDDTKPESPEQGLLNEGKPTTDIVRQSTLPVVAPQKLIGPKQQGLLDGESANMPPRADQIPIAKADAKEKTEIEKLLVQKGIPLDVPYYPKQFLDLITKSNSATLEILLAAGDRAAANGTFEALYLDYRLRQGAEYKDNKSFWEAENANPNKDAINYADQIIDETQTQTTSTTQAGIYSEYASSGVQNMARLVIPFSRFNMNARSAVMNKMAILNDPTIDESQKRDARNFIKGKIGEVAFFRATSVLGWTALATGTSGLLAGIGAVEKDDIERYGGITKIIGSNVLPVEDRDIVDIPKGAFKNASSVEMQKVLKDQMDLAMSGLTQDMEGVKNQLMTYERKFSMTSYTPEVLRDVTQDVLNTLNPVPRPAIADDALAVLFNMGMEELGVPVEANEFLTGDMKGMSTSEGVISMLSSNAGIASIAKQQFDNLSRAFTLRNSGKIFKYNPMTPTGEIPVAVSALSEDMRNKIDQATSTLLYLRLSNIFVPGLPKSDINKFAGRLERQLETIFDAVLTDADGNPMGEYNIKYEAPTDEPEEPAPVRKNLLESFGEPQKTMDDFRN